MELTAEELRVLGCLIEKGATTPDHYPLSTNALTNACNQKTSRDPVVSYSERVVSETMLLLRPAGLARTITSGRTQKHRHVLDEAWGLGPRELAVLAIMMLRGPQSAGELKTRTERYVDFDSLDAVEQTLARLAEREEPLVVDVGRQPGQSQNRWMHTLGPHPTASVVSVPEPEHRAERAPQSAVPDLAAKVADLEDRLARIERELGL
jgi:uncharacterized protein YceH (UPF0502 family)